MRALFLAASLLFAGCVLRTPERDGRDVDPSRELEVVDDDTLAALSRNAVDAPLSFRHAVEILAGDQSPEAFMASWLTALGPEIEREVRSTWSANGKLPLDRAPFRLIAVANRMDLAGKPGLGALGEGRLVFAVTDGPADDAASKPRPMTVILEFALPATHTAKEWAASFHALGGHPLWSPEYRDALAGVASSFVTRTSLSQVRWNDMALGLRELHLGANGQLEAAALRNTPPRSLDGASALVDYVNGHGAEIEADAYLLPSALLATSTLPDPRPWSLPGASDAARESFALGTCGGCHAHDAIDGGFHVSPLQKGEDKLSPMLRADLERRATLLREALHGR